MNIIDLQASQLSKYGIEPGAIPTLSVDFMAEFSPLEGDLIPFAIRTGPVGKPDPGLMKQFTAVEINGDGRAYVMVWIQNRLVAYGTLFAQEAPKRMRRLNIPRGLGNGYDIDLWIAFQGRMTGYEVFYDLIEGSEE